MSPQPIDTLRALASPEGVELPLSLAGPIPRALAWFADFLVRLLIFVALSMVLGALLGGVLEYVLLRRLRGADIDTTMLVMIGAWIALQNAEQLVWSGVANPAALTGEPGPR